ncbi:MAG: glycosyltransferase family 2 protein, partial [Actinomycetes bacterium]
MPTDATLSAEPQTGAAPSGSPAARRAASVTAVLVAHDGSTWLPRTLAALAAQTREPDCVVAVDTGSADDSRDLLTAALGERHVLGVEPTAGFGDAVRRGLAHAAKINPPDDPSLPAGPNDWVWLLHDDVEAAPDALEQLLAEVARDPSTAVAGPKVRGWYDRRLLLEVGVTIARSGRRETLLERREQDQGQHDGTRQVLAVSTAGMLVRRDVWDELGGLDPALPLLRDDVDFGWRATLAGHRVACVTDAVVHHAEAAARSRRPIAVRAGRDSRSLGRLHRLDRQHAMQVLLTNLPLLELPVAVLRLTLGALVRALGLLLGKLPTLALDEVLAWCAVIGRPDHLVSARVARRATRREPARAANRLLAPRGSGWRHRMETVHLLVGPGPAAAAGGAHRSVATGPTAAEAAALPP